MSTATRSPRKTGRCQAKTIGKLVIKWHFPLTYPDQLPYKSRDMKNLTLSLLLTTAPLFAGVEAPIMAPPAPDCEAGFTFGIEALYLRPYQSEGQYDSADYDFGGRGSIGYDFNDCLFVKATYFGYSTDIEPDDSGDNYDETDGDLDVSYIDLVVGEHFKPSEKLTLSPYVGFRWAQFEEQATRVRFGDNSDTIYNYGNDFSGFGVVVGIDATRTLASGFSLYGTAKQAVVFGSSDNTNNSVYLYSDGDVSSNYDNDNSDDRVLFITELGLGVQFDFNMGSAAGNIRAGVEGQWWSGISDGDSENTGLAGFVLGANFKL